LIDQLYAKPAVVAWLRLLRGSASSRRRLDADLQAGHGLTVVEYETLLLLSQAEERAMRRVDLARELGLTPSGVTRLLDALERDGLVTKGACSVDARVTYAVLTDAGAERLGGASCSHEQSVRALFEERFSPEEIETLSQAALLHDIGKIAVPDGVLLKNGPLDHAQWLLMRGHPQEGARIIAKLGYLEEVVPAIRHHHERPDGQGYPDGLAGDAIPVAARIIHVADALDAMTTQRVYRDAMSLEDALDELERGSGTDFCSASIAALCAALDSGLVKYDRRPRETPARLLVAAAA